MTRPTSSSHPAPSVTVTRRGALGLAGFALAGGLATPAIAQPTIEWKMATAWPADLPGPGQSAQRICDAIALLSGGRMRVRLFPAGGLVAGSEVFDAVSAGTAQMGHASPTFWQDRLPAAVFFATVPFGFLPHEHVTWIGEGGGQDLWDRLYAPFAVKPFPGGNGGGQLGGWYMKPLQTLEDLKGLRVRMPGLGGEVMRRLGATPVSLPPSELVPALKSGLIDAAEFLGPESDRAMGFQTVSYTHLDVYKRQQVLSDEASEGAMFAFAAAGFMALAMITVRRLTSTERTSTIVVWFAAVTSLFALMTAPFGWVVPDAGDAVILVMIGLLGGVGQILLTQSYRYADASTIAPFEYTTMIWTVIVGWLVFSEIPTVEVVLGALIVIGAGVFVIYRERQLGLDRSKERRTVTPSKV